MARILIAWELGGGYGHIAETVPLALRLRDRGHTVRFALRDLSRAEAELGAHGFDYVQAPVWLAPKTTGGLDLSLAEILAGAAYRTSDALAGLVKAWLQILTAAGPDLIVAEFAPTALIAARIRGIAAAAMGTGFAVPPLLSPIPSTQPWVPTPPERLAAVEGRVVAVINRVLDAFEAAPLDSLSDLYRSATPILRSFAELDHYGARDGVSYFGTLADWDRGVAPRWPGAGRPRIFAYLSARYGLYARLVAALAATPASVLIHARDLPPGDAPTAPSSSVRFEPNPVSVAAALTDCDIVVSHGGHGLSAAALKFGRPVVAFPMQTEQAMLAYRLHTQSLGIFADAEGDGAHFARAIATGLQSTSLRRTAAAAPHDPKEASRRIAELCGRLCGAR